jgi:hypothetical protein
MVAVIDEVDRTYKCHVRGVSKRAVIELEHHGHPVLPQSPHDLDHVHFVGEVFRGALKVQLVQPEPLRSEARLQILVVDQVAGEFTEERKLLTFIFIEILAAVGLVHLILFFELVRLVPRVQLAGDPRIALRLGNLTRKTVHDGT